MERTRYSMWAKTRKPDPNRRNILAPMNYSCGDSREEQAFAEDAAGRLGGLGCVWPPRSYSCSFCRREFRSAQALGGHMNVHRRDRARLRQSPIPIPSTEVVPQSHALDTCTSGQLITFLCNNPNPELSDTRVSSPPTTRVNNIERKVTTLCFLPPSLHKNDVVSLTPPPPWSSFVDRDSRAEKKDCVTEDLPTNMSNDGEVASCKRRRIEAKPSSFFPKVSAVDRCVAQSEVLKLGPAEELDLELRLGDAPKVK